MIDNELVRRDTKVTDALEQIKQQAHKYNSAESFKQEKEIESHTAFGKCCCSVHTYWMVVFVLKGDRVSKTFAESQDHIREIEQGLIHTVKICGWPGLN